MLCRKWLYHPLSGFLWLLPSKLPPSSEAGLPAGSWGHSAALPGCFAGECGHLKQANCFKDVIVFQGCSVKGIAALLSSITASLKGAAKTFLWKTQFAALWLYREARRNVTCGCSFVLSKGEVERSLDF